MKTYKLVKRITDENEIRIFAHTENWVVESELQIEDNYYIRRILNNDWLYYIHIKDDKIIKICVYREDI